jgi:hypothetical protein
MKQAIETRYYGPTNTRGSRVGAKAWGGSTSDNWNCADNQAANHCRAAMLLCAKMGWHGVYVAGGKPDERGNVYVGLHGTFSREWCEQYLVGVEREDWFIMPEAPRAD